MAGNVHQVPAGGARKLHALNRDPVVSLGGAIQALVRWRSFIILFTLAAGIFAFVLASSIKRDYEAVVSILINPRGIQVVDRDITPRNQTVDGNIAIIESQRRVLESVKILRKVVELENLASDPEFNGSSANPFRMIMQALRGQGRGGSPKDKALEHLRESVATHRPKLSYVVELSVLSEDPEKAARLANRIAEVFLSEESDNRSNVAQSAADNLKERLAELGHELAEAENAVEQYKAENNILNASGSLINEQELSQVNRTLIEARNASAAARVKLSEIKRLKSSGSLPQVLPEAVSSNTITQLRIQLSEASQRKLSLSAQYLDTHPAMIAEELRIKDIRKTIFEELDRIAAAAEIEYNNAVGRENELQQKVTNLTNRTFSTNDAQIRLRELEREANSKRVVYEAFLVRAKELGEQVRVNTDEARIISPATPPSDPTGISPKLGAVAATIGAFGLACAIALISSVAGSLTSPSISVRGNSTPANPAPASNGNPLSAIFRTRNRPVPANDTHAVSGSTYHFPVLQKLKIPRDYLLANQVPMLFRDDSSDAASWEFQKLAATLVRSTGRNRARTVMITGFEDEFSRTTFASNLALASAMQNTRVLLVSSSQNSAEAIHGFTAVVAPILSEAIESRMAVGQSSVRNSSGNQLVHWPMRELESSSGLNRKICVEKLRDRLSNNSAGIGLVIIDAPLLDSHAELTEIAELSDEVIVTTPEFPASGNPDSTLFGKLGSRKGRIRGAVKSGYFS